MMRFGQRKRVVFIGGGFESPLFSFSYHFLLLLLVIAGMVVMVGRWKRG